MGRQVMGNPHSQDHGFQVLSKRPFRSISSSFPHNPIIAFFRPLQPYVHSNTIMICLPSGPWHTGGPWHCRSWLWVSKVWIVGTFSSHSGGSAQWRRPFMESPFSFLCCCELLTKVVGDSQVQQVPDLWFDLQLFNFMILQKQYP